MLFNELVKLSRVQYFKICNIRKKGMDSLLIFLIGIEKFMLFFFFLVPGDFPKDFSYLKER